MSIKADFSSEKSDTYLMNERVSVTHKTIKKDKQKIKQNDVDSKEKLKDFSNLIKFRDKNQKIVNQNGLLM